MAHKFTNPTFDDGLEKPNPLLVMKQADMRVKLHLRRMCEHKRQWDNTGSLPDGALKDLVSLIATTTDLGSASRIACTLVSDAAMDFVLEHRKS
jgi:hypothetical protein